MGCKCGWEPKSRDFGLSKPSPKVTEVRMQIGGFRPTCDWFAYRVSVASDFSKRTLRELGNMTLTTKPTAALKEQKREMTNNDTRTIRNSRRRGYAFENHTPSGARNDSKANHSCISTRGWPVSESVALQDQ